MKRLTITLSLALVTGGAAGVLVDVPSATAKDEYTLADWDKNYEKQLRDAADNHRKVAKWCDGNGLQWTATRVLRGVFRYLPEDPETRAYFGYEKQGERWVQNELKRDTFRTQFVDDEDPNGDKFRKNLAQLTEKIATAFSGAATKAEKMAADPTQAAVAAEWKARAAKAWWRVLDLRPESGEEKALYKKTWKAQEDAHKTLGHPKFEGEYVTPFALRHLEVRSARVRLGKEVNASDPKVDELALAGPIAASGLTGGSSRSANIVVHSTHGKEVATRVAKACEKAIDDAIKGYQFPEAIKERLSLKVLHNIKPGENGTPEELRKVLGAAGWPREQIERYVKADFGGMALGNGFPGERVGTTSDGRDAEDHAINVTNQACSYAVYQIAGQSVGVRIPTPEDWLWQSMGYDATLRINDSALTVWGAFGKYGQNVRARPGQNVWIQLARQQVELDDDVTMTELYVKDLGNQEFKGREIVKGYAFLQFLFESDEAKGREFVWNALPLGTPAAAMKVFGPDILGEANVPEIPAELPHSQKRGQLPPAFQTVMDELEARYRKWIMEAW